MDVGIGVLGTLVLFALCLVTQTRVRCLQVGLLFLPGAVASIPAHTVGLFACAPPPGETWARE